ncbi:hypothetical protein MJD09_04980 [bacterium]|nr:hypothetical protein [bacterium]
MAEMIDHNHPRTKGGHRVGGNIVVDPICGMKIKKEDAAATVDHKS